MKLLIGTFIICNFLVAHYEAAKILGVFPMPSKSHVILAGALLKELARRGHEVTMLSPFPFDDPPTNYTDIHWNYMSKDGDAMKTWSDPNISGLSKLKMAIIHFPMFLDKIHENENLTKFKNSNEKFDLCIYLIGITDSFLGICNHVNATAIGFNTVGMNVFLGQIAVNPAPYSYAPNIYMPFSDKMTFYQRVANTIAWTVSDIILYFINAPMQRSLLKKHFPNAPPLEELVDNVDLFLANSNYATDTLVPLMPNIIPIGGFHLQEQIDVSADLKAFLDESKKGVIYFNLGTNAKGKYIKKDILHHILNTFEKMPYNILWKYEEELPYKPPNVRVEKWLPQRPILMHPHVKLFMTHGGFGGTVEAIYGGVPMICLPLFGDQNKNCAGSVSNGYAVTMDLTALTEDKLTAAINEVLHNKQYKENIMLKSDIYRNQAVNPMDRAIFWVEHVLRHKGAKHLKPHAANLPWYQYMLLDVFVVLGFSVIALSIVLYLLFKLVIKCVCVLKVKVCKSKKFLKKKKIH